MLAFIREGGCHVMRVVSGSAKGRPLKAVPGMKTRPTTDKVKEAIFSMIGPYFTGGKVLDLYAGTGGLGIEALSRGMDSAVFIDRDPKAVSTIRGNVKHAGMTEHAEIYRNDAVRALAALAKRGLQFDLVFLDPPYKLTNMDEIILMMEEQQLLQTSAIIVIEHDADYTYDSEIGTFHCTRRAEYGEIAVSVYRR